MIAHESFVGANHRAAHRINMYLVSIVFVMGGAGHCLSQHGLMTSDLTTWESSTEPNTFIDNHYCCNSGIASTLRKPCPWVWYNQHCPIAN